MEEVTYLRYLKWIVMITMYQFTQLPACKPVLTPTWVITTFFLVGALFIPIGLVSLHASHSVVEIVDRYDSECVPDLFKSNKVVYIKDMSIHKNCSRHLKVATAHLVQCMDWTWTLRTGSPRHHVGAKVHKHMKAPIFIYYQLDNYYQNHRSLFNDTYSFSCGTHKLRVNRKNIAWKSDRNHKFGMQVYPFNFQKGTLIGGGKLDPNIPVCYVSNFVDPLSALFVFKYSVYRFKRKVVWVCRFTYSSSDPCGSLEFPRARLSDQEDLIVWMHTAALPSFRKLYGRIEDDLNVDDVVVVNLLNNYNTYSFGGTKKLVLSTSSWLGGRNNFLGMAYTLVGFSSILVAFVFLLLHVRNPRYTSLPSTSLR
ncbi:hypothetical protein RJ639_019513 [Escallonia herrerae]|uniref:ALA-interacting subunit n=1 Tax=Escallonia herrerae TaxID=1293975 RepID=A0AA88V7T6_9ASTE|nr:hypothetical protein RJ639_019513 [Escallonia herrerae]